MKRILLAISLIAGTIAAYTSCEEQEQTPEIIKVESVTIDQADLTLTEGESVTLTATVLPEDAADKNVAWSSSNDDIVMIASNGKAKAMSLGKAVITAKAGDKTDFITITVSAKVIPVTGISLTPSSITMNVGETQTITAEVTPQDATDKSVTWVSSNPDVATVENGTVTGLNPGSVTVTATTVNGGKTGECAVTVKTNLVPSVTVGADHISAVSAVLQGKANLESSSSSDLMVGFQYSKSSGILPSNSITTEAEDSDSEYNYTTGISDLEPNTTYYYRSLLRQNGQDYYGETRSFATLELSAMLETLEASEVKPTSACLNAKLDLKDVLFNSLAYGFLWGSSKELLDQTLEPDDISENVFTSAMTGLPHKTQYWYKAYVTLDSQTFSGEVKTFTTDVVPVDSVSLDKTEYTFNTIGNTLSLSAIVLPADATDKSIIWSSDKEDVATVDQNGNIKAIGNGTATITVETNDQKKTATCEITVAQLVTNIILSDTSLTMSEGQELILTATVNPSNANDKSLTWMSLDESVAKVDQTGKVTAVSIGTTTIRATANDVSGIFASCDVIVPINLSANGSANCYIVSAEGPYIFRTTKGNSSTSVGTVSSVKVLWGESLVKNVSYSSNAITFLTPSPLTNGNALIAAEDASGNILWSWHIWICGDFDPSSSAHTYYNNACVMMDRNLGAISPISKDYDASKFAGLLYQWGRKDPFRYGSASSMVASSSTTGTIAYSIANPTTFIYGTSSSRDWLNYRNDKLWGSKKTIYDPCPPGWRVPDGGPNGVWAKAVGSSDSNSIKYWTGYPNYINFGEVLGPATRIYYPAAGSLMSNSGYNWSIGTLYNRNASGGWWSCTPHDKEAYEFAIWDFVYYSTGGNSARYDLVSDTYRDYGQSVRCVRE